MARTVASAVVLAEYNASKEHQPTTSTLGSTLHYIRTHLATGPVRKGYVHTRVCDSWDTHPPSTASPFGRINLEPSQATASKHRSPHSVRVRGRVRVRVGWSALGATAKRKTNMYLVLYTWYHVFWYRSSTNSRMRISNSRTRVRILCHAPIDRAIDLTF